MPIRFSLVFLVIPGLLSLLLGDTEPPSRAIQRGEQRSPTGRTHQVEVRLYAAAGLDKPKVLAWAEALRKAGAASVTERPGAEFPNSAIAQAAPGRVVVHGLLDRSGTMLVGREKFRSSEAGRLAAFFQNLREHGAPGADATAPFWGLSEADFARLRSRLQEPSQFTDSQTPLLDRIAEVQDRTGLPVKLTRAAQARAKQATAGPSTESLALGTAFAYQLYLEGFAFEPRQDASGNVSLEVLLGDESARPWPIGLVPDGLPGKIAPRLLLVARYQTNNMPLEEVLQAFARELEMDVLLDRLALEKKQLDASRLKSTIAIPGGTFSTAIRRTLAPLGLRSELRIDEANRPFLWVTVAEQIGTVSRKPE